MPLRASFTPCSKYIFCGGSDGFITFWQIETGKAVLKLKSDHMKSVQVVDFNPKYHMFASCCNDTVILRLQTISQRTSNNIVFRKFGHLTPNILVVCQSHPHHMPTMDINIVELFICRFSHVQRSVKYLDRLGYLEFY